MKACFCPMKQLYETVPETFIRTIFLDRPVLSEAGVFAGIISMHHNIRSMNTVMCFFFIAILRV